MTKEKGTQTKYKLITTAAKLFLEKGYNATGISEILGVANVPKGSFYFHFSSKKELASCVAEYHASWFKNWLENAAIDRKWTEFIRFVVTEVKKAAVLGRYKGCPLGALGMELAFVEPELSKKYAEGMDELILIFKMVFVNSGLEDERATLVARSAFALYEGYIQYYRISKEIAVLDYLLEDLLRII